MRIRGVRSRGLAAPAVPRDPAVPARPREIAFFKRFLRDFMALYKFNKVVMEVNASMRLDRHPEMNAGWIDFAQGPVSTRSATIRSGPRQTYQNSAHHDTADGEILEKDEVADLVRYADGQHIEVIPEIPTFTHSYYLLTRHKELGAIAGRRVAGHLRPHQAGGLQAGVRRPGRVHRGDEAEDGAHRPRRDVLSGGTLPALPDARTRPSCMPTTSQDSRLPGGQRESGPRSMATT